MSDGPVRRPAVKILLNSFWNHGAGMSGGDQMVIQVFKRLRGELASLSCVTSFDGRCAVEAQVAGVDFEVSPRAFDRLPVVASYILRTFVAMRSIFRRVDVVYSGSDFFPDVIPAFCMKLANPRLRWIQCVFHIYPDWRGRPGSKVRAFVAQYLQLLSLRLARRADILLNINHQVKDYLVARGFPPSRIAISPPGIDLDYLRLLHPAQERYDGVFLGRLNPSKGIFDLVNIWSAVVRERPAARLAVIGGGSPQIFRELKTRIAQAGLQNNVHLLGFQESDRAFALVKSTRVFLFPSHEEGFGIAIVEALACGVPVVAWDLPALQEHFAGLIDLVNCFDHARYAKRLLEVLDKGDGAVSHDQDQLKRFSWEIVSSRVGAMLTAG